VLGKAMEREYNLFDLLRRPGVDYDKLMGMNQGKYASADVQPEALGELSAPVIEQVEIAAKYSGYIDRQKDEVERRRISSACAAAGLRLHAGGGPVLRGAPEAAKAQARNPGSGLAHFGRDACSHLAAHGASEKGGFKGFANQNEEASA
jgi:tRNA uridine 5-carboxymethylaminomethyl modification enzyme